MLLKNVVSGETREVKADGIFFFVGMVPQTEFVQNLVACDPKGYILVNEKRKQMFREFMQLVIVHRPSCGR